MRSVHLTSEDYAEIKNRVGMRQAAQYYGYPADRRGLCICPFHNDKHPSMKLYPHNRGYYCWACGSGGDVITFVSKLYGMDNESAARKIIDDFALPIKTENLSYREQRERERKVLEHKELQKFVRYASGILNLYRSNLCEASADPHNIHFPEALQNLSIVEYRQECLKKYPREMYADKKEVKWIGAVEQRLIDWDSGYKKGASYPGRNFSSNI